MRWILAIVLCAACLGGVGCTYVSDLERAQHHFQANQHERALALLRVLENDLDSFGPEQKATYAYLRGMTDYRLSGNEPGRPAADKGEPSAIEKSYRFHARYWLGVANAVEKETPGSLRSEWKANVAAALRDLNQDVFGVGVFWDEEDESESDADGDADDDAAAGDT
ncbi:MAG: hypothetical protein FWD57_00705 [Polyangiaceae bacterium]|nr:hypothetical protein [Polyangiaceae bacterium]